MTTEFNAAQAIDEVTRRLQVKYPDWPAQQLRGIVTTEVEYLQDRPVLDYVTVLAGRAATKRVKKIRSESAEPRATST